VRGRRLDTSTVRRLPGARTASDTRSQRIFEGGADLRVIQSCQACTLSTTQIYSHVDARRLRRVYDRHPRS
jgi:site-specific recombinase XerC